MKSITFDHQSFKIDGNPVYLNSGEFHYFRVPRSDWRRRMQLFKQAGGNCLATYIPWLLHEPEEGRFVFGESGENLDLEGFLQAAKEEDLYVVARPGPYQYSELIYDGLPGWLCENYPELLARNISNEIFRKASVSYAHPLFLAKVHSWFGKVCPILARYTLSQGGPVAFVQLDNEMVGIHEWFGSLDYNPTSIGFGVPDGRYPNFLRRRFGDISSLNREYGSAYDAFEYVPPPQPSGSSSPEEIRRRKDYFDFYLATIAEYSQSLAEMIREFGIDVPLVHNSANPHMNAYFLETAAALGDSFLLGSDHYYNLSQTWAQNNPTPQYAVQVFCSLETLRLMGYPPTVFELPGGSASNWPPITPEDAAACYMSNLAYGMKGHNYYIFTGGPNPPGAGATTDLYDFDAAIGADGQERPLYAVQRDFGHFIEANPWLPGARRLCDVRFAVDFEQARAHKYWPARGSFLFSGSEAYGFLLRGALTTAFCASLSARLCDLGNEDWVQDRDTPLVVISSSSMAAGKQERIVRFLKNGGRALIAPVLPQYDENLKPCTSLVDFLGSPALAASQAAVVRPEIGGVINVLPNGRVYFSDRLPRQAQVTGIDELSRQVISWKYRTEGGGEVIFLGMSWEHAMREHERMLVALLKQLGLRQIVYCSNPNIWTSWLASGDQSILFILNLFTAPMEADIRCQSAQHDGIVHAGHYRLGSISVTPVRLPGKDESGQVQRLT
ncbi:MAG: beta-galactosidase [Omnitrophica WOR_2 bacterium]